MIRDRGAQPGRLDVAQLVLQDMRNNIKKALYMETLGRPEGTPMTATEVSLRMKYGIPLHADITKIPAIDVPLELVQCIVEDQFDKARRLKERQGRV